MGDTLQETSPCAGAEELLIETLCALPSEAERTHL